MKKESRRRTTGRKIISTVDHDIPKNQTKTILSDLIPDCYYKIQFYTLKEIVNREDFKSVGNVLNIADLHISAKAALEMLGKSLECKLFKISAIVDDDDDDDDDCDDDCSECDSTTCGRSPEYRKPIDKLKVEKPVDCYYTFDHNIKLDSDFAILIKSVTKVKNPIELKLLCGEKILVDRFGNIKHGACEDIIMDADKSLKLLKALCAVHKLEIKGCGER